VVIEIIADGIRIGTITRCGPGIVIARLPNGEPLGQLGDIDAAVLALALRDSEGQTSDDRQH
jgi:hypothetical protein